MNDKIVGRPIRCNRQKLTLKRGRDFAEVMFVGDAHYGSRQFDEERFLRVLKYCLDNFCFVFLMGDLIEMATRNSIGAGVYEQRKIGQDQHEQMVEWLMPLANKHLLIGNIRGNHELRLYDMCGVDISKALSRELNVPFLGDACWNQFCVGSETYNLYTLHGTTGSRFDGTSLLCLERIGASFFCDGVFMAHAHKCINSIQLMQKIVNGSVVEHKKHLVITGSFLKYDGSYAQRGGLSISKLGAPRVRFYGKRHDMMVSW